MSYSLHKTNNNKYSLEIYNHSRIMYETIIKNKLLPSAYLDTNGSKTFLSFYANRVSQNIDINITDFSYDNAINLINTLSCQINFLKEKGYAFIGIDLNDIIIIDDSIFIIIGTNNLYSINKLGEIQFNAPFQKPFFSSPELLAISKLPSSINYKSSYYSLGALVIYCLFNKNASINNIDFSPISNTKLYWFLKRCFKNVEDRQLLFM